MNDSASSPSPSLARHTADLIVVGGGAAGLMGAISAARRGHSVIVCEKMKRAGLKLIASGGGRCNLTNTLEIEDFMSRWGRTGRFMHPALRLHDQRAIRALFSSIGVESHAPDGFRVWPKTHDARTVQLAMVEEAERLGVTILCHCEAKKVVTTDGRVSGLETNQGFLEAPGVLIATGGKGYPGLGSTGAGHRLAQAVGHKITPLHPAMQPLFTREPWPARCTAYTLPKVEIRVDLKKARKVCVIGDVIFTKNGIAGPAVMDLAREVTPFLDQFDQVPLLLKLTGGRSEDEWVRMLKSWRSEFRPEISAAKALEREVPPPFAEVFCELTDVSPQARFVDLSGQQRAALAAVLAVTPLTVVGSDGWSRAMVTRGGVRLKDVHPETLESKVVPGLFFAGEVLDLDGPCGGFNLTWAFSSGLLAGQAATNGPDDPLTPVVAHQTVPGDSSQQPGQPTPGDPRSRAPS